MTPHEKQILIQQIRILADKMPGSEIAERLGVSRNTIAGICYRNDIKLTFRKVKPVAGLVAGLVAETKQHGPLSINFPKKTNFTVSRTLAAATSEALLGENSNAKAVRAVLHEATPRVESKTEPNYNIGHPVLYMKTTHSKPLPPEKVKPHKPGKWASSGCLAVIGESRGTRIIGCCQPTVDGVYCAAHDKEYRTVHTIKARK